MADQVYECILTGYLAGEFVQTIQHVQIDPTPGITAYTVAKEIAIDLVSPGQPLDAMIACLPTDYVCSSLRVRRTAPTGGPTAVVLAADFNFDTGQRSGSISSAQANPLVIWIPTDLPAKTGRVFLPGVSETDISEMKLTSGLTAAITTFIAAWIAGATITAGQYLGCVYRRSLNEGDIIADGRISPLIGTQRKRLHPV